MEWSEVDSCWSGERRSRCERAAADTVQSILLLEKPGFYGRTDSGEAMIKGM